MRSLRLSSLLLLTLALTTLFSFGVPAQSTSGSLSGLVTDPTGAVIPGATITLTSTVTGAVRTTTSDEEGRWKIPVLDPGSYRLTIEASGFKKGSVDNVTIEAAVPRTIEVRLEAGQVSDVINITTSTDTVQTETATTFRQITGEQVVQVPTSTRSFTHLLSVEAGVSSDLPPVLTNGTGNISPSVNGTRTTSTSVSFNGIDATNLTSNEGSLSDNISPAPETLEEVKLQTSLYDASTGRSGGGNFQLVTRSGSNVFHGSLYHYLQNEKLNANDFFFNKDGIERPQARRNEGGFTLGGPAIRDRIFFFGGYQFTRARTGFVPTASSQTVLPEALRLIPGDATAASVVAAFRQLNPNFQLTEAQISPVALALLNLKNPATGGYFVARPAANATPVLSNGAQVRDQNFGDTTRRDITRGDFVGGNPLVRQRNVFPAEFEQDQFTLRMDGQLMNNNRLSGTFFFANFPGFDPFPDPSSLASPVTLQRNDRNRTLAVSDTQTFGSGLVNEARFGYFLLNNSRRLQDQFEQITSASVFGLNDAQVRAFNPSLNFNPDDPGLRRLGHFIFRNNLSNLSFGAPNDVYNRRRQESFSFADNVTWVRGSHTLKLGGEFKRHNFDTNLPEEQQTEFEKFENFTQFLAGRATEADTQFGVTDKNFRMRDLSWYVADDFKLNNKLTLNFGVRYEWFAWPEEKNGRIGNVDFSQITNPNNITPSFIIPGNAQTTGFAAIDGAIAASTKVNNKHTLNGQDVNNLAPRFGFAFTPFDSRRLVVRGGYGVFFDRPSAAFINTVFSNYPFLREIEVTAPARALPILTAFSQQDPSLPFNRFLPNRVVYRPGTNNAPGTYEIRDGTPVTRQADGSGNPAVNGQVITGNVAETFEFRAVDRNLRTPYVQQWNLGFQYELAKDLLFEARYVGTKGTKLLQAIAFNQGYDLNDSGTPDFIFQRFVDAYTASGAAGTRPLNSGSTARDRGRGVAFGFPNPALAGQPLCLNGAPNVTASTPIDFNLSTPLSCNASNVAGGGSLIGFEARGPFLGFNIPEAVLLQSSANSIYNALQLSLTSRLARGLQFNTAYTWSKSIDNNSSDPGSTAGGGKPDVPNTGFVVQGDQRNLRTNRSVSDFDRTHRFSAAFVYELPFAKSSRLLGGWEVSGFAQMQTGLPFTIFAAEPEVGNITQYTSLTRGSGGLYRLGFGRPNLAGSLSELRQQGADITEQAFNASVLRSALGGFGNLGRNTLRGEAQHRFDVGLSKTTNITERINLQFRWDVFNVFNNVNFALPNNDLQDTTDFGRITSTIGGPRVMQFGLKLKF
jgi:hypothetical protein